MIEQEFRYSFNKHLVRTYPTLYLVLVIEDTTVRAYSRGLSRDGSEVEMLSRCLPVMETSARGGAFVKQVWERLEHV